MKSLFQPALFLLLLILPAILFSQTLKKGESITEGEFLGQQKYSLMISEDGDLEIWQNTGEHQGQYWHMGIENQGKGCRLIMQDDGNLCLYKADGGFVWCSMEFGETATMEDDGRLVQRDAKGQELWASYMPIQQKSGILKRGQALMDEWTLYSRNGQYYVHIDESANLVITDSRNKTNVWSLGKKGDGMGTHLVLQNMDGNLCFYSSGGNFIWCSMAFGKKLVMENDGRLVQYDDKGKEVWASVPKDKAPAQKAAIVNEDPPLTKMPTKSITRIPISQSNIYTNIRSKAYRPIKTGGEGNQDKSNLQMGTRICINGRPAMVVGSGLLYGPNRDSYAIQYTDESREKTNLKPEGISLVGECKEQYVPLPQNEVPTTMDVRALELAIIKEVNIMRSNPKGYADEMNRLRFKEYGKKDNRSYAVAIGKDRMYYCKEGDQSCQDGYMKKIKEAIAVLRALKPLPPVTENTLAAKAAQMLAADAGKINGPQHLDSKGRSVFCRAEVAGYLHPPSECLNAGHFTAAGFVVSFLTSPGHRAILIKENVDEIGVDVHKHGTGADAYLRDVIIMGDKDGSLAPGRCN